MSVMTIPTPAQVASRMSCHATKTNGLRTYTCGRKGVHDQHIDYKRNVSWRNETSQPSATGSTEREG